MEGDGVPGGWQLPLFTDASLKEAAWVEFFNWLRVEPEDEQLAA
jgi:hypothetical protein